MKEKQGGFLAIQLNAKRFRQVVLVFSVGALVFWVLYGFDSGLDQVFDSSMYGKSLHFSSITLYGLLYYFVSEHLEELKISGFWNITLSISQTCLNIAAFEIIYIALFNYFQIPSNPLKWITQDFWFTQQYFCLLIFGVVGIWILTKKTKSKLNLDYEHIFFFALTFLFYLAWITYPGQQISFNGWTSNRWFPQTHYAYVNPSIYLDDPILHSINVVTKTLFVLFQIHILKAYRCKRKY